MNDVDELLKRRNSEYEDAWLITGKLFQLPDLVKAYTRLLEICPEYAYNWMIILNKLIRLLGNPFKLDSWQDIAGYATLVVKHLEENVKSKENSS